MLTMKTVWRAVLGLGLALLIFPNAGWAQADLDPIHLDGTAATGNTPMALTYARETLGTPNAMGLSSLELDSASEGAGGLDLFVTPRRAIQSTETVYLRIDLDGAQFASAPTLRTLTPGANPGDPATNAELTSQPSSGGADSSFTVVKLGTATDGIAVAQGVSVGVRIPDVATTADLMVAGAGGVTATIAYYTDPDDALEQVGARNTFAGSAAIIRFVSGVSVTIKAAADPVASVATGFLRFEGGAGTARLGWLGIQESLTDAENMPSGVRSAANGMQLVQGGVIAGTAGVDADNNPTFTYSGTATFSVMGNLDIGAFNIKMENDDFNPETDENAATCDGGMADTVDQGDLVDDERMPLIGEEGELPTGVESAMTAALAPDVYLLCVNVDVTGPMSNMTPIPKGDYSASAYLKRDAMPNTPTTMVGEGELASIDRDGASVEIPYLTTSEKHNQRIIVVNRGTRPVPITDITFTTEDGVDVELTDTVQTALDNGLLAVPAQSSWVAPSREVISFTSEGARRTAATISFFGTRGSLSVATTQVNISDGSTDTVVYDVD